MKVERDEEKNSQNYPKHGISFAQAQEVFLSGEEYLEVFDEEHSKQKDQFIMAGAIRGGAVFIV